jgi:predicted transglutaminase-like cysteine proteinase
MDKKAKRLLIPLLTLLPAAACLLSANAWSVTIDTDTEMGSDRLFGYFEIQKQDTSLFPQWLSVLERHILESNESGSCHSSQFNQCHLEEWQNFLSTINKLPEIEQVRQINRYANEKEYTLDIENYGIADYWATPQEFLINNGDCEDYAIIKMLSMKWLGYDVERMRVVVVQDTNLRIPHAVMAIEIAGDILILDNQIEEVISHNDIYHYVPVYSVNESRWWMHIP